MKKKRILIFRIYIGLKTIEGETIDNAFAEKILKKYFKGATLFRATGIWQGSAESSLVAEILTDEETDRKKILATAEKLKTIFSQEEIWIEETEGKLYIV